MKKTGRVLFGVIVSGFLLSVIPKSKYIQSVLPPGMVLVKGEGNVPSFLISKNPCSNFEYAVYKDWLTKVYLDYPEVGRNAEIKTSDTVILWNDPMVSAYMGHPAFGAYPVVGVSWYQAMDFCRWKNDRVNESIFLELAKINAEDIRGSVVDENQFNTEAYLAGHYEFSLPKGKRYDTLFYRSNHYNNINYYVNKIKQQPEFLYGYRLPSEEEWELAMAQHVFSRVPENITVGRYDDVWATGEVNLSKMSKGYSSSLMQFGKDSMNLEKTADWLFDIYGSEKKSYKGLPELLGINGMIYNPELMGAMDQYGEIDSKDSLGMFDFRIMSWLPGGYPLIADNYQLRRVFERVFQNGGIDEKYKKAAIKRYKEQRMDSLRMIKINNFNYNIEFDVDGKLYKLYLPYPFVSFENDMESIVKNQAVCYLIDKDFTKASQRVIKRSNWRSSRLESKGSNQVSFRYMVPWIESEAMVKYAW